MKKIVIGMILTSALAFADGCWDLKDKSSLEFDELNDKITFSIKNAIDCKPVAYAKVNFGGVQLKANKKGKFSVPLDVMNEGQKIKMLIKADKYISLYKKIKVEAGTVRGNKILLSPILPVESVRFVLSWGKEPRDMDNHLVSDEFHISYRNTKSIRNRVKLDRDAKRGYGPETITLEKVDAEQHYTLYAYRFSKTGKISRDVEVSVYINNRLDKTVKLPNTDKRVVKVLEFYDDKVHYKSVAIDKLP
jgi:hypothetical protein